MKQTAKPGAAFAFEWKVDQAGYVLTADRAHIQRAGGSLTSYRPDDKQPPIHHVFASSQAFGRGADGEGLSDEEWALEFVKRYGFIGSLQRGPDAESEPVEWIVDQRGRLGAFMAFYMGPHARPPTPAKNFNAYALNADIAPHMTVRLERSRAASPYELVVVPRTLIAWMWLRVAREIAGEVQSKKCARAGCTNVITIGSRNATRRRRFCSDSCRALHAYEETKAAKPTPRKHK